LIKASDNARLTVDAVVFDLDGTLIDSLDVHCKILNSAFVELGLPAVSKEDILKAIRDGEFDWDGVLPEHMKAPKEDVIRNAREIINEIYPQIFRKEAKMIAGVDEILKEIARHGMKIGLVTSTPQILMEDKLHPLKGSGVEDLFDAIITTDDVPNKKPAADPLIECGKRLDVDMAKMVYVGDTRTDIKAGHAAGMKTVGVLTGNDDYEALTGENPDVVIGSVVELRHVITFDP